MKAYIEDGDLGINYEDEGPWRSYDLTDCCGDTPFEAIENCTISEVDQDGGELNCYGFDDAPIEVQDTILRLLGISWDDIEQNEALKDIELAE